MTIGQIAAASHNAIVNDQRRPTNQWADSTLLSAFEEDGFIDHRSFSHTLEMTLDYRRNPGSDFLATDLTPLNLTKTEVLTAATYSPAQLATPVTHSKFDEMNNPSENQKVSFTKALVTNGITSHDEEIEQAMFAVSTDGFLGFQTIIPDDGQSVVGGISAVLETWWRNHSDTYAADGSDIEAVLTEAWNTVAKGSGSKMVPTLLWSGSDAHALYESTLTPQIRYASNNLKGGALKITFKTANFVFSQYGDDHIYGGSPKALKLMVSKQYFRQRDEEQKLQGQEGWTYSIYSGLQMGTCAKSRLFVVQSA